MCAVGRDGLLGLPSMKRNHIVSRVTAAIILSLAGCVSQGSRPKLDPQAVAALRHYGYSSRSTKDLALAYKSNITYIRLLAVDLLIERGGREAIPILRSALRDVEFMIRWRAAHWLGTQGDKSGLETMRWDMYAFSRAVDRQPPPFDPNWPSHSDDVILRGSSKDLQLSYAAMAATVMAELGDPCGYSVAVKAAKEGELRTARSEAVKCLVEIATFGKDCLKAGGMDPVSELSAVAEAEQDDLVVMELLASVRTLLDADTALQILRHARNATNKTGDAQSAIGACMQFVIRRQRLSQGPDQTANKR
jgi:hypothetical protein